MDDYLRIAIGPENVSAGFEIGTQLTEIVDLPIESNPDRSILIAHGLVRHSAEVDDRQPAMRQSNIPVYPHPLPIGTTVGQGIRHLQ
jgi:hypothetical protein